MKTKSLRLILLLLAVACGVTFASAQEIKGSRTHLKAIGGFSYSTLSGEDGVFGPVFGARFDTRVSSQPVYVGAGLEYMNRGFEHNSNHSILVPFLGSYQMAVGDQIALEPFAGTVLSYGFDWKNWDCGIRLGCNIRAKRWDFSVAYDLGLRHYDFGIAEGRTQSVLVSVGYNFDLSLN